MRRTRLGFLLLTAFLLCGCSRVPDKEQATGIYFDTPITFTIYALQDPEEALLNTCFEKAKYYEDLLSKTVEGSDVWKINHSQGCPIICDPETITLLSYALEIADQTEGLIDPTIEPLSSLWNFSENAGQTDPVIPEKECIRESLSHVDHNKVLIQGNQVTLTDPGAGIDLGFVAKGYIADQICQYLSTQDNVTGAVINLGGNVVLYGEKPDKNSFQVGFQKPFADIGTSIATTSWTCSADKKSASFVSSGIYERYYEKDGVLYHHILDTNSGYPADTDLNGVTIYSTSSMEVDALSTTCLILGYEKARALIDSIDGVEALFLPKDGSILTTEGFPPVTLKE